VVAQLDVQGEAFLKRGHLEGGQPDPLALGILTGDAGQRHPLP
jgi:hypothetical protein